jgi:hypothetical protein
VIASFEISSYVQRLDELGEIEITALAKEVKNKPWCASYRMLLARAYTNENSYLKNKTLRLAATYSGRREQLFELMHTPSLLLESDVENKVKKENKAVFYEESKDVDEVVEAMDLTVKEEIQLDDLTVSNSVLEVEDRLVAVEVLLESTLEENTEIVDANETVADEELVIVSEMVYVSDLDQNLEISEEELVVETEDNHKTSVDFDSIVVYDPIKELPALEKPKENKRVELPFDMVIYDPEKELTRIIEEKATHDTKEHDFLYWLNNIEHDDAVIAKSKENFKSPDKVQELLDQFLATKRSRPIKNATFYNVTAKAEESIHDNMDVLSETLASLYVKQGYLDKAKIAYEKLSLQNPSKSAYFAARITEIEQQQKEI